MEQEDAHMQNADATAYPDPSAGEQTPYPSLPSSSRPQTPASTGRPLLPAPSRANTTYTSLADYFSLGNAIVNRNQSDGNNHTDASAQGTQPWTNDFFSRLAGSGNTARSLPGYHFLPDDNNPSTDFFLTQQTRATLLTEEAHPERGNPRSRPRGPGRAAPPTRRRRGWKWALQGTEHEDIFTKPKRLRGPYGKRRGRGPGRPRTSVNATGENWMDPGADFRQLQGEATRAYLDGENEVALDFAIRAAQVNPEVFMAHKMIHDILQQQGDERGAVVALSVGVNTKRDAELWAEVGERILDLRDRTGKDVEWARDCFLEAIKLDKDCYRARAGKLRNHEDCEDWEHARVEVRTIVQKYPEDLECVLKYAEFCGKTPSAYEWERAKEVYEKAFACYEDKEMLGFDVEQQWTHLNVYLDILLKLGYWQQGIRALRRMSRWFLGRRIDVFWDDILDDREWDTTNERRVHLWQFQQGRISRDPALYGEGLPMELRVKLGLFRLRVGAKDEAFRHFRHLMEMQEEAEGYEDMFLEVAECVKGYAMFDEAVKFYEPVKAFQDPGNLDFWLGLAQCYNAVGRNVESEECYLTVTRADLLNVEARVQLTRVYAATGQHEKAYRMADEVERVGREDVRRKAAQQQLPVREAVAKVQQPLRPLKSKDDLNRAVGEGGVTSPPAYGMANDGFGAEGEVLEGMEESQAVLLDRTGTSPRPRGKGTRKRSSIPQPLQPLAARDEPPATQGEVHASYALVQTLWLTADTSEEGIRQWIVHANALATVFRNTIYTPGAVSESQKKQAAAQHTSLLPRELLREMRSVKKRAGKVPHIEDAPGWTGDYLYGISIPEWHRVLSELILLYAKHVDQEKCYDMLENVLNKPAVFRLNPELWNTTQALSIYCAQLFNDSKLLIETAQAYISRSRKRSGSAIQLFAAAGRLSHGESYFYDRKTTRWIHEVLDAQSSLPTNNNPSNTNPNLSNTTARDRTTENGPDPALLTICGHINSGHKHSNARPGLPYLFRALAIQPDNAVINLSIATTIVSEAIRAPPSSRQYEIAKGQAFLSRYYELRVASGRAEDRQEAEFNSARMWQLLGLMNLAEEGYRKVLEMSESVGKEMGHEVAEDGEGSTKGEGFEREAAFALQRIYLAAGNEALAREVGERWLVL